MPKSARQKLKLLYIKDILESRTDENHTITTAEIIELLRDYDIAVERKAVYDDIEQLCLYGLDVVTEKYRGNRYYVASRDFELAELKLLVDAVQSSKFITVKKSAGLIKKIEGLCSKNDATQLHRQVFVTNRIKNMNESIYYTVDDIHNAITDNKKITFKYFRYDVNLQKQYRHDGESYCISPYALMWDDENYYLLGYDSKSEIFKHYRVDRIDKIEITDSPRDGAEEFRKIDLSKYNSKYFSMFGGNEEKVKLRLDNELINVVLDRFGKNIIIDKSDSDSFIICVDVMVSPQFYGWIASFGEKAKIISPQSAVDGYKEHLKSILSSY